MVLCSLIRQGFSPTVLTIQKLPLRERKNTSQISLNHKADYPHSSTIYKRKNDEFMLIKLGYPSGARPQVFTCELMSNFTMFPLEILSSTVTHQTNCKERVLILMCGFW